MNKELTKQENQVPEAVEQAQWATPPVDIYENNDELLLIADLPGVTVENLKINIEKDELVVEGRRDEVQAEGLSGEYPMWNYRRSFRMPRGLDQSKVSAELKFGVLKLHLPKAEAIKPRPIPVAAA